MKCNVFKRSLYHLQAGELSAVEHAACQEHLNDCAPCAALLEVEEGLLRGLKARLAPVPAPPGLETRIRAELRRVGRPARPGMAWIRQPWFAAMAASVLLAVLLLPGNSPDPRSAPSGSSAYVTRVVTVVDRTCDLAGRSYEQQRQCRDPRHLNVVKLEEGGYWHLSTDRDTGRELTTDRAIRGTRMRVEGRLFERIRTLQLESAQRADVESASLTRGF